MSISFTNEYVHIILPKKYHVFADQIEEDSSSAYRFENEKEITLYAKEIVIDLDKCKKRKGRKLTIDEEDFLLTRHLRQPRLHVHRLSNRVYIQRARGASKCEVHLPMKAMDIIKENARVRNKTLSQMFVEMADYYLVTFGDATKEIKEYISNRHDDLHRYRGPQPEIGISNDKRTRKSYHWPDYPRSMTIDKIE